MMCKLKGQTDKEGHYDVEMKGRMQKGGIIMCKLKGQMDNEGIMIWKSKGGCKRGQYDSHIKREDG